MCKRNSLTLRLTYLKSFVFLQLGKPESVSTGKNAPCQGHS